MRNLAILIACIWGLYQGTANAQEACNFRTWRALVDAADRSSVELSIVNEHRKSLESSKAVAGLNPASSIGGQFYKGLDRLKEGEFEANYSMVWEKNEKREARLNVVSESLKLLEANRDLARAKTRVELVIGLHRLQQIKEEQAVLLEARQTYGKLGRQLQSLPVLSPEQQLTLSIFQMAADESASRIATLENEAIVFSQRLVKATGCNTPKISFIVAAPQRYTEYRLSDSTPVEQAALATERQVLNAEAKSTSTQAMQDIEFGPIVRFNNQDGDTNLSAGLAVSIPLTDGRKPVFEAEAAAKKSARDAEIDYRTLQLENERQRWLLQYQLITLTLSKHMNLDALQSQHRKMEELFSSGRVNAALVIEGHRQIIESLTSRHGLESQAIEALWNLHLLSGNIFEAEPK